HASFSLLHHPPTIQIYTLSLHDALPIFDHLVEGIEKDAELPFHAGRWTGPGATVGDGTGHLHEMFDGLPEAARDASAGRDRGGEDRKSTRLNSSHSQISYAVFCLKKKKK